MPEHTYRLAAVAAGVALVVGSSCLENTRGTVGQDEPVDAAVDGAADGASSDLRATPDVADVADVAVDEVDSGADAAGCIAPDPDFRLPGREPRWLSVASPNQALFAAGDDFVARLDPACRNPVWEASLGDVSAIDATTSGVAVILSDSDATLQSVVWLDGDSGAVAWEVSPGDPGLRDCKPAATDDGVTFLGCEVVEYLWGPEWDPAHGMALLRVDPDGTVTEFERAVDASGTGGRVRFGGGVVLGDTVVWAGAAESVGLPLPLGIIGAAPYQGVFFRVIDPAGVAVQAGFAALATEWEPLSVKRAPGGRGVLVSGLFFPQSGVTPSIDNDSRSMDPGGWAFVTRFDVDQGLRWTTAWDADLVRHMGGPPPSVTGGGERVAVAGQLVEGFTIGGDTIAGDPDYPFLTYGAAFDPETGEPVGASYISQPWGQPEESLGAFFTVFDAVACCRTGSAGSSD